MDRLSILDDGESSLSWRNELIYWCVHRQVGGMQGRPNKDEDTWYVHCELPSLCCAPSNVFFTSLPLKLFLLDWRHPSPARER